MVLGSFFWLDPTDIHKVVPSPRSTIVGVLEKASFPFLHRPTIHVDRPSRLANDLLLGLLNFVEQPVDGASQDARFELTQTHRFARRINDRSPVARRYGIGAQNNSTNLVNVDEY